MIYILPQEHTPDGKYNYPKYLRSRMTAALPGLEGMYWTWANYSLEDSGVAMVEGTDEEHEYLAEQVDVLQIPDLDKGVASRAVKRVRDVIEDFHLPGSWVKVGTPYRTVIRMILGVMEFHNPLTTHNKGRIFKRIQMTTPMGQVDEEVTYLFQEQAQKLGLDFSKIERKTTMRELLYEMGYQCMNKEFEIGGVRI